MTADAGPRSPWSSWWLPILAGVISLLAGVVAIAVPGLTLLALALIAGINLVILGAFLIGEAIGDDGAEDRTLRIVLGVLGIIAGVVVMRRPGETLLVLILALGVWLILDGVVELVGALMKATERRALLALSGVIDAALGVLILALPDLGLGTLAVLVGIGFVVRGATLLQTGWRMRSVAHRAQRPGATPFSPTPA